MKFSLYFFSIALLLVVATMPLLSFAQSPSYNTGGSVSPNTPGSPSGNSLFVLENPLGIKNFCDLVKNLLNIVLAIGVPIAVLFLVWAGFRFIFARGNPTELGIARKNFMYVIAGIAIFLGAWTLASVISATIQTLDKSNTIQFCGRS